MAQESVRTFTPRGSVGITAGPVSDRVVLPGNGKDQHLRVCNSGNVAVWIEFGGESVAATMSSMPILPGTAEIFDIGDKGVTYVAAITDTENARIGFTSGEGT